MLGCAFLDNYFQDNKPLREENEKSMCKYKSFTKEIVLI